jgi:hypothetical protein
MSAQQQSDPYLQVPAEKGRTDPPTWSDLFAVAAFGVVGGLFATIASTWVRYAWLLFPVAVALGIYRSARRRTRRRREVASAA